MDFPFLHEWRQSRYPMSYLRLGLSEEVVQNRVLARLWALGFPAWPVDSGAKNLRGKAYGALKRAGLNTAVLSQTKTGAAVKGFADVFAIGQHGRAILLEVKKPAYIVHGRQNGWKIQSQAGQPTGHQLNFLLKAYRAGAIVGVVWSSEDAAAVVTEGQLQAEGSPV